MKVLVARGQRRLERRARGLPFGEQEKFQMIKALNRVEDQFIIFQK